MLLQPPVAGETDQEHYVRQIEALTEENALLRRKSVEVHCIYILYTCTCLFSCEHVVSW